jgi:hypothetical protein
MNQADVGDIKSIFSLWIWNGDSNPKNKDLNSTLHVIFSKRGTIYRIHELAPSRKGFKQDSETFFPIIQE